ncbi:hypothetical protein LshimejAT787_0103640 [Lyophyllum shimeji]|uniref:Terpene synthase n=1 Tax=Lyophyllum shimeji TaxID=47721 RepID=A0A9P3PCL7_LYOSH|nr:hypothetical protein LshimejAT787_0103640 [Lyophyllum shimeji]
MVQYLIQNLLNILRPHVKPKNPNHAVLEAEYVAWIDDSPYLNDEHKKAWKRAELPLLMSRAFPEAELGPLRVSLDFMMLFLMLEQLTDAPATPADARKWADIYIQAYKQTLEETKGLASLVKELASRVVNAVEEPYRSHLIASNVTLAEGTVKEASDRESPSHGLSLEAYMDARRDSVGIQPFFDLQRWISKLDIPQDVLKHPGVMILEEYAINMGAIANDLYSYKKEFFESGAHHNFVAVAMRDPSANVPPGDRQKAITHTCKQFTKYLEDFHRQKKELPSFGRDVDKMVEQYSNALLDIVAGSILWSLVCRRYGHLDPSTESNAPTWGEVVFEMDPL